CASNIHQIVMAAITRCQDNPRRPIFFPNKDGGSDSLGFLIPAYIKDPQVAICPATNNYIRRDQFVSGPTMYPTNVLTDIENSANNRDAYGHSYEPFAWYSGGVWPDGRVIDGRQYGTFDAQLGLRPSDPWYVTPGSPSNINYGVVKRFGKLFGATTTILIADIDKDPAGASFTLPQNNWPDPGNNHGNEGANFGFADGHVEFVRRGPQYIMTFIRSYQGLAQWSFFTTHNCPGLSESSTVINGHAFTKYVYSGN
ncbi:MAG: H-X9-DG-CTERM domain-containing protein, partial [Tepidisphaeraceae bacterium]